MVARVLLLLLFVRAAAVADFDQIVQEDRTSNHVGLPRLQAIDARKDVNGVRTKDGEESHVHEIEVPEIDERPLGL